MCDDLKKITLLSNHKLSYKIKFVDFFNKHSHAFNEFLLVNNVITLIIHKN